MTGFNMIGFISIRSSRMGGDPASAAVAMLCHFNPLSPHGERRGFPLPQTQNH